MKSSVLIGSAMAAGIAIGAGGMSGLDSDSIPDLSGKTLSAMQAPSAKAKETGLAIATEDDGVPLFAYCKKGDGQAPQPYLRCKREMKPGELFEVLTTCEGEEQGRIQYLVPELPSGIVTKAIVTVSFYTDVPESKKQEEISVLMAAEVAKDQPSVPVGGIK